MAPTESAGVRARAAFGQRAWAFAARIAAVMLALYLTSPLVLSETAFEGFDASVTVLIAGALIVAACGALALARAGGGRRAVRRRP